ncbi:MAG: dihydrofolate reductase family protein [Candidatus Acidiferrales bacterium]
MKKLIWLVDMSLDGFMSGPNGELDWAGANMDDEMWEDVIELLNTVDTALFGRVTYQAFESYWPGAAKNPASPKNEQDFSRWIEKAPKSVASGTLKQLAWKNSMLLSGDVAEGVSKMKAQPGKNALMFGSCSLAAHLLKAGLIDELRIRVHPVVLGAGRALFKDGAGRQKLKLIKSRIFGSGVVALRYDVG